MKTLVNGVTLYSVSDVAKAIGRVGSVVHYAIYRHKILPEPTVIYGDRRYYTEEEFNKIAGKVSQ